MKTFVSPEAVTLPRHVKKPGGAWKRVDTQAELEAALTDGWVLRLPAPAVPPTATGDAPLEVVEGGPDRHNPQASGVTEPPVEAPEDPDADDDADEEGEPSEDAPHRRKPGRPRKGS